MHSETPKRPAVDATRQSHSHSHFQLTDLFTTPVNYRHYNMADPKKQEKDYTSEVDALLPEARSLAEVCYATPVNELGLTALGTGW